MNKNWLLIILLAAAVVLSACNGAAAGINSESASAAQPAAATNANSAASDIPISIKLALGTLKLNESSNDITAEQAAALLPLWKAVRSLGSSETVAAEEINALYDQIQATMTPEQIAAIDQMQLTRESMAGVAQELGIEIFGRSGQPGNLTPEMQATAEAARASGQFPTGGPEGGFPGGGPGGGGGGGFGGNFQGGGALTPEQQATMTARREASGGRANSGIPTALLDALIQYLETNAG